MVVKVITFMELCLFVDFLGVRSEKTISVWFRPDKREHLDDKNLPGQIIEKTSGGVIGCGGGSPVRFCQIWYHTCTQTSYKSGAHQLFLANPNSPEIFPEL